MPYQPRPIPIRTQPPMAAWQFLDCTYDNGLRLQGDYAALSGLNLPGLTELVLNSISIQQMVWAGMPRLEIVVIDSCDPGILDMTQLRSLRSCQGYYNMPLTGVDVQQLAQLESLSMVYCPALAWVIVADCPQLRWLYLNDAALSEAAVDQLLEQLADADANDGQVDVTGGSSAAPSAQGEAYRNILVARGWSIYTNGD